MARGAPDYSNVTGGPPLSGFYDQGEIAARLGSPVVYDKSGILVWYTDFENGLQGSDFGVDHEDSKGGLTAGRAFHGSFSCMFDPRGVADSYVEWGRVIHFIEEGRIGVEMSLSIDDNPEAVRLTMFYYDEDRVLTGLVHYQTDGGVWKIPTKDDGWVNVLEEVELQPGPSAWHPIKLVIDTKKKTYVRLLAARHVVELTKYGLIDNPSGALGQLEFRVDTYGNAARHAPAYIDGVIVTQNEP